MNDPGAILDYASPRPRGKVRLPSQSTLEVREDADSVTVVERLSGKAGAILAIVFAAAMFALLTATFLGNALPNQRWQRSIEDAVEVGLRSGALFVVPVLLAGLVVMLLVVNNTWRRTVLLANADGLLLRFFAPLTPTRVHAWPADRVEAVRVESTDVPAAAAGAAGAAINVAAASLAELQIHPVGGSVAHLFTDHEHWRLAPLADSIARALGRDAAAGAAAPPSFTV